MLIAPSLMVTMLMLAAKAVDLKESYLRLGASWSLEFSIEKPMESLHVKLQLLDDNNEPYELKFDEMLKLPHTFVQITGVKNEPHEYKFGITEVGFEHVGVYEIKSTINELIVIGNSTIELVKVDDATMELAMEITYRRFDKSDGRNAPIFSCDSKQFQKSFCKSGLRTETCSVRTFYSSGERLPRRCEIAFDKWDYFKAFEKKLSNIGASFKIGQFSTIAIVAMVLRAALS
ncbi:hypothetical protein HELRODRAFT_182419 [Helobdella robusta]|uniref:Uncharacterized protein n=1 Tax=Helobdella robusta TaxID=6412 RepID=T1FI60_HELRO|nr:hypothetical protein HELRODRAFT_182419 [Helobdella robusta]ESN90949.1 hypothetical protein HELRODRAFT_182419 [Helobdella robusta]